MSREWQPGDVALVEAGCWANRKVALRLSEGWSHVNGTNVDGDGIVSPVRPLVVIDPEDRAQIERLAELMWSHRANLLTDLGEVVADAIREYAEPQHPKCKAALIFKGEHYPCDQFDGHGMTHGNTEAGAIWGEGE